ncbi:MAG: hypothetical protein RSA27_06375 [Oscillospiraceae bacterium]
MRKNSPLADIVNSTDTLDDKYYYTKENCGFYDELKKPLNESSTFHQTASLFFYRQPITETSEFK